MLMAPMRLARQVSAFLIWAAIASRGLFAQQLPSSPETMQLRGVELRYVLPDPMFDSQSSDPIKALYVNAWAFGSSKLAQLVRLADSTEINAFVVDVKDDTGCLLYPSEVKVAQEIGATKCVRTKDVQSRLDTLRAHDIYAIARIVVAKGPLLAERRPQWSVQNRDGSGLWRDRIGTELVHAAGHGLEGEAGRVALPHGHDQRRAAAPAGGVHGPPLPLGAVAPRVARQRGQGRGDGSSLPASLCVAVPRAQRRQRAALRLSRLEVRR